MHPTPPFFLFDGACGFCKKWANWLQRRVPADVAFLAYQDVDDLSAYGLTEADVETASYWIDEEGIPHRGAKSFTHALRQAGGGWGALGVALEAPLIGWAAGRLYTVIARNRHRLPAPHIDEVE